MGKVGRTFISGNSDIDGRCLIVENPEPGCPPPKENDVVLVIPDMPVATGRPLWLVGKPVLLNELECILSEEVPEPLETPYIDGVG